MLRASLPDHVLDIEGLAQPCVQLAKAQGDLGTQLRERIDSLEQLASELPRAASGKLAALVIANFRVSTMLRHQFPRLAATRRA